MLLLIAAQVIVSPEFLLRLTMLMPSLEQGGQVSALFPLILLFLFSQLMYLDLVPRNSLLSLAGVKPKHKI